MKKIIQGCTVNKHKIKIIVFNSLPVNNTVVTEFPTISRPTGTLLASVP